MSRSRARQAGFTLMEAIVAMVLISGTGLALYGWINGNIAALSRVHDVNARSEATTNILEYMNRVNPMLMPEGGTSLGMYAIRWRANPVSPVVDGVAYPRGRSLYQLALFETTVAVSAEGGSAWFELKLKQVGYKQVRSIPVGG